MGVSIDLYMLMKEMFPLVHYGVGIVTCMLTCCTWLLPYPTSTHSPSICPFARPHLLIRALSMRLPPVLWAWIRAPATHFLGARILTTLTFSIHPAALSATLALPFSVIVLSSQYEALSGSRRGGGGGGTRVLKRAHTFVIKKNKKYP